MRDYWFNRVKCQRCKKSKQNVFGWFGLNLCNECITFILSKLSMV